MIAWLRSLLVRRRRRIPIPSDLRLVIETPLPGGGVVVVARVPL